MSLRRDTRKNKKKEHFTKRRGISGSQIPIYSVSKHKKPGDDFYKYVNEKWLNTTEIPATKSAYGVSEEIEKTIEKQSI